MKIEMACVKIMRLEELSLMRRIDFVINDYDSFIIAGPQNAGACLELIQSFKGQVPIPVIVWGIRRLHKHLVERLSVQRSCMGKSPGFP